MLKRNKLLVFKGQEGLTLLSVLITVAILGVTYLTFFQGMKANLIANEIVKRRQDYIGFEDEVRSAFGKSVMGIIANSSISCNDIQQNIQTFFSDANTQRADPASGYLLNYYVEPDSTKLSCTSASYASFIGTNNKKYICLKVENLNTTTSVNATNNTTKVTNQEIQVATVEVLVEFKDLLTDADLDCTEFKTIMASNTVSGKYPGTKVTYIMNWQSKVSDTETKDFQKRGVLYATPIAGGK